MAYKLHLSAILQNANTLLVDVLREDLQIVHVGQAAVGVALWREAGFQAGQRGDDLLRPGCDHGSAAQIDTLYCHQLENNYACNA